MILEQFLDLSINFSPQLLRNFEHLADHQGRRQTYDVIDEAKYAWVEGAKAICH